MNKLAADLKEDIDLVTLIESTSNFLRGLALDPLLMSSTKAAIICRVKELDAAIGKIDEQL